MSAPSLTSMLVSQLADAPKPTPAPGKRVVKNRRTYDEIKRATDERLREAMKEPIAMIDLQRKLGYTSGGLGVTMHRLRKRKLVQYHGKTTIDGRQYYVVSWKDNNAPH